MDSRTLYLFSSAAPPVFDIARVIEEAQADGWDVCLGLTPTAARWLADSLDGLAVLTGHPVRWDYKLPGEPDVWPEADAILVAPATFTTVNAWALGITDKYIVGVAAEGIGKRIPMVTMPCLNDAQAVHPQFERSVETLRGTGVSVLHGEGGFVPNHPGQGDPAAYPWRLALDAVLRPHTD
ncbi:flavoprotein [Streptomyces sp. ISL-36]|uniref:flavoprotein n=1 Tax=Streptomyces sp. ISL-36 TaxID=2819182 RepID=UPI001BE7597F|nr:flavoprotein [Streptomyces sp. ISL-36]MBT2439082.1 flavoprotein [Streptomyces sp. ISL-36]